MKYVHVSAKVTCRIENLKNSGKAGNTLARKVVRIIECLKSGTLPYHQDWIGNFTRYGEKRIRNCRKFDLGSGFRLIALQRRQTLFIPFLGTHDECQRWLENNSKLKKMVAGNGRLFRITQKPRPSENPADVDLSDFEADAGEALVRELSDQDLRQVFSGLVEGARKHGQ